MCDSSQGVQKFQTQTHVASRIPFLLPRFLVRPFQVEFQMTLERSVVVVAGTGLGVGVCVDVECYGPSVDRLSSYFLGQAIAPIYRGIGGIRSS